MEATNLWFLWEQHWSGFRKRLSALTSLIDHLCSETRGDYIYRLPRLMLHALRLDQDRVHSNLRVVLNVRLMRATPEEKAFASPFVNTDQAVSPFFARVLRQPLNALLIVSNDVHSVE